MKPESSNWIFERNLRPFVEMVARLADYSFDANDWIAVSHGVRDTDQEADRWFTYSFEGAGQLQLEAAIDPGTSVVHVRVRGGDHLAGELQAQLDLLIDVCQTYTVT